MVCVLPVSPAGTVHDATTLVRLVTLVMAARKGVHDAGTMSPVTQKLGNVGGVILDGRDPGVRRPALTGHTETPATSRVAHVSMVTVIM